MGRSAEFNTGVQHAHWEDMLMPDDDDVPDVSVERANRMYNAHQDSKSRYVDPDLVELQLKDKRFR